MIKWLACGYVLIGFITTIACIYFWCDHDDIDTDEAAIFTTIIIFWPLIPLIKLFQLLPKIYMLICKAIDRRFRSGFKKKCDIYIEKGENYE